MRLSDIIGQPQVVEVVQLALSSPYPCSLLISGILGSGKSSLLSAIRHLPLERRVVTLPATLSPEELGERSDIERTLTEGRLVWRTRLSERLSGAIVLIDNANLMSPEVLSRLLDIQACSPHDAPICLIAAVNPEEGALRSTLLDRFDLYVDLSRLQDPLMRVQILRQSLQRERMEATGEDHDTAMKVVKVRRRCLSVKARETDYELAAEMCRSVFVLGHRADIALLRAATVYAATQERDSLTTADFLAVKDWVLTHRLVSARRPEGSPEEPSTEPSPPSETEKDTPPSHSNEESVDHSPKGGVSEKIPEQPRDGSPEQGVIPERREDIASLSLTIDPIDQLQRSSRSLAGFGSRLRSLVPTSRGRYYRSTVRRGDEYTVSLLSTIREAIPHQRTRREEIDSPLAIIIHSGDFRYKSCRRRTGYHILFAVDASGSMGARQRMHRVKGLVVELLRRAYEERDYVGLLTFRGDEAELVLPMTKSIARAHALLSDLRTGGRTPLYLGLSRSLEVLKSIRQSRKGISPVLVLVTDGRATSRYVGENSPEALRQVGESLRQIGVKIIVVDSEEGFVRMGRAAQLAELLKAEAYCPIASLID